MKTALLFAGQGAQSVGMCRDIADRFPAAREVLEAADRAFRSACGRDLTTLMFEGPEEELHGTENAQPAVLAMGVACLKALESRGELPDVFAAGGLSLGEYGAYVAAGAIGFEDAVPLVRRRGELMRLASEKRPGGMASVLGLSRELVLEACREAEVAQPGGGLVGPANYNSPGQIVISGEIEALGVASELAKAKGAKRVVPLKVSGAFHTALMQPAADGLAEALAKVEIRPCRFPVLANATAGYVREPEEIRRTLLKQLTGPVLFEDSVKRLVSDGVTRFVELGPGKVLSGLVKRIVRSIEGEAEAVSLGTAEAIAGFSRSTGARSSGGVG